MYFLSKMLRTTPYCLLRNLLGGFCEGRNVNDDGVAIHMRCKSDGVAPALLSNRRNVDGGGAMAADDVLPFLAVAIGAADEAGIEGGTVAAGLLDHHEADGLPIGVKREE